MANYQLTQSYFAILSLIIFLGCSSTSSNEVLLSGKIPSTSTTPILQDKESNELKLEGAPISCHLTYAQSLEQNSNRYFEELHSIIYAYAKAGLYKQALDLAQNRTDHGLDLIARQHLQKGELEQAFKIAERIVAPMKEDLKVDIAKKYAEIGKFQQALSVIDSNEHVSAVSLDKAEVKAEVLAKISAIQKKEGQIVVAEENLRQAFQLSLPVSKERVGLNFLSNVVSDYAEVGEFETALRIANRIQATGLDGKFKAKALISIAHSYLNRGQSKQALATLYEAEEINRSLLDEQRKHNFRPGLPSHFVFSQVQMADNAIAFAEVGELQKSLEVINYFGSVINDHNALMSLGLQPDGVKNWQVRTLLKIVEQTWKTGQKVQAENLMDSARKIISTVEDRSLFGSFWIASADVYQATGQTERAKKSLSKAFSIVTTLPTSELLTPKSVVTDLKTLYLNQIIKSYMKLKDFNQALTATEAEVNPQERNRLLKLIQCATQ